MGRAVAMAAVVWCAATALAPAPATANVTADAGPVTVTVSPTSGLADGQPVSVHATAPDGVVIYEIAVHVCLPGSEVNATINFSFVGDFCSNSALGAGDAEKVAQFGGGVRTADLDGFKVGVGNALWVTDLGKPHFITCGPGNPCDLVVQLQITNDTVFMTAPLCFGDCPGASPAPPPAPVAGPAPGPSGPTASGAEAASAGTSNANGEKAGGGSDGGGDAPGAPPGAPTTPTAATAVAQAGKHTPSSSSSSSSGDSELAAAQSRNATVATSSDEGLSRGLRVVIAAVVGALCAIRIFFVVLRVRKRSSGLGTA